MVKELIEVKRTSFIGRRASPPYVRIMNRQIFFSVRAVKDCFCESTKYILFFTVKGEKSLVVKEMESSSTNNFNFYKPRDHSVYALVSAHEVCSLPVVVKAKEEMKTDYFPIEKTEDGQILIRLNKSIQLV